MPLHVVRSLGMLVLAWAVGAACAQVAAVAPTRLSYVSAISSYRPYADPTLVSWPAANAQTAHIGGWRAYAKEAAEAPAALPSASPSAPAPAPAQPGAKHDHHPMHPMGRQP